MSHFVMADLHGCDDLFFDMLRKIRFSKKDELFIIGDVIDRGLYGVALLQYILSKPNICLLLGNHELMMREALHSDDYDLWFYNGGEVTLAAYDKLPRSEQGKLLGYLDHLPLFHDITIEQRSFRLIHGSPMEDESDVENSVWQRPDLDEVFFENKTAIIGHTPTLFYNGEDAILYGKNLIDIDCGAVYGGRLGCLRLEDMREYYVNAY